MKRTKPKRDQDWRIFLNTFHISLTIVPMFFICSYQESFILQAFGKGVFNLFTFAITICVDDDRGVGKKRRRKGFLSTENKIIMLWRRHKSNKLFVHSERKKKGSQVQCDQICRNVYTWVIFKRLWQFLWFHLVFGKQFENTLAKCQCYWANFHCWKWPNIKIIQPSSHTDRSQQT